MERLGRELSASQLDFMKIQHRKNEFAAVGKKRKRSTEEDAEFKKLQNKLKHARRDMEDFDDRLLFKPPPKSNAQRQAQRKEKRTKEAVEKENNEERVRLVAQRAGGLSEARLADVRAGRRKNKSTGVYSGDALRNMEIEAGTFLVEPLTGGSDGLGNLGDVSCNHCGALRYILSSDQLPYFFAFCKMVYLLFAK